MGNENLRCGHFISKENLFDHLSSSPIYADLKSKNKMAFTFMMQLMHWPSDVHPGAKLTFKNTQETENDGRKYQFFNQDRFCFEPQNKAKAVLCPAVLTSTETGMAFCQQQICGHSLIVTYVSHQQSFVQPITFKFHLQLLH